MGSGGTSGRYGQENEEQEVNRRAMSSDPKVVIYGDRSCGYCAAARMLLKKNGVTYENIIVSDDADALEEMQRRSGRRTVPQIFIGDRHVGGFDDLYGIAKSGELDRLLAGECPGERKLTSGNDDDR